jgi:hypothetical protein
MYKATIATVSLLGTVGVVLGVLSLSSGPHAARAHRVGPGTFELAPPPLEPASAPELSEANQYSTPIEFDEARIVRRPKAPVSRPAATPKRELHPCSEWEDVGPKAVKNPDGTVEMRRARLLC